MISDKALEEAVDYLEESVEALAKKESERWYLEEFTGSLKAQIMAEHLAEPLGAQERYAKNDIRFKNHLKACEIAVYEHCKEKYLREAKKIKIDVWRTQQASNRERL